MGSVSNDSILNLFWYRWAGRFCISKTCHIQTIKCKNSSFCFSALVTSSIIWVPTRDGSYHLWKTANLFTGTTKGSRWTYLSAIVRQYKATSRTPNSEKFWQTIKYTETNKLETGCFREKLILVTLVLIKLGEQLAYKAPWSQTTAKKTLKKFLTWKAWIIPSQIGSKLADFRNKLILVTLVLIQFGKQLCTA